MNQLLLFKLLKFISHTRNGTLRLRQRHNLKEEHK